MNANTEHGRIEIPARMLPEIRSNLTRRDFLAGAGSLLVLGAAGCSAGRFYDRGVCGCRTA